MTSATSRLRVSEQDGITRIEFVDRNILDEANIQQIGTEITKIVDAKPNPKILISFANVDHLSSAALGTLITINNRVLIRNKVAAFIITGGQDGIQAVAGQMMGFFSEIGYVLPQFPFIAHSLGWEAEDMERNVDFVRDSDHLRAGARELVGRAAEMARCLQEREIARASIERGGRKASSS